MDEQVNPLERDHCLFVVLPGGLEKIVTVHGSQPVMDVLVTLCASYHLNPSDHTVEVLSPNKNIISFKPNSPIGLLEAQKMVLKPKVAEGKIRKPYMPEATVRLLINYNKSHKAVLRVNPRVPLESLMRAVCDKCEFQVETTVLLRDSQAHESLDLTKSLNEHGLREVFAKDTAAFTPTEVISPPPLQAGVDLVRDTDLSKKTKRKESKGFLSLFRRNKKPEMDASESAPASPGLNKPLAVSTNSLGVNSSNTLPADMPKKRRAPRPPMGASQSVPNNLDMGPQSSSAESTLKRTKRRAPPPPCANARMQLPADTEAQGIVTQLHTVEELRESDESETVNLSRSSSSSTPESSSSSSPPPVAHLCEVNSPHLPTTGCARKDLEDVRFALARILTSSLSSGALAKHSFMSMTQKYPDNGGLCGELGSVLRSKTSTEPEREDPLQRKGLTTFKVVPSKKPRSYELELSLEVPDQCQVLAENNPNSEASVEARDNQTESPDQPCSPESPEAEVPLPNSELQVSDSQKLSDCLSQKIISLRRCQSSPPSEVEENLEELKEEETPSIKSDLPLDHGDGELVSDSNFNTKLESELLQSPSDQSLGTEMDQPSSESEKAVVDEEVQQEGEDTFPPPPPPIFYCEDIEEGREDPVASTLPSSKPSSPISNGQSNVCSGDHQDELTSATSYQSTTGPKPTRKMSTVPSRFAQAVALAVQRSRFQSQGKGSNPRVSHCPCSTLPSPPRPHANIPRVPDWLPHISLNGSSCLG